MLRAAREIVPVLLADSEDLFDLGHELHIRIVDLIRVKFLHLFFRNEASLMAEPLLGQVLAAVVPNFLLGTSLQLLVPVFSDFHQYDGILGLLSLKFGRPWRARCRIQMLCNWELGIETADRNV